MRLAIVVAVVAVLAVVAFAAPAAAGPLGDAIARHDAAAVEQLRARRAEPAARCALGAVYARRGDLPHAGLYLSGCGELALPDDIAADVAKLERDIGKQLRDGELASIEVSSTPDGATAECTAFPGEPFTTPATLWVKPGVYDVRTKIDGQTFQVTVETKAHARSPVWLGGAAPRPAPNKDHVVNIDTGGEPVNQGTPAPVKRGSLMSKKLRGEVDPAGTYPVLDDPLAARAAARPPRPLWLGLRLGGGMFDDGAAAARAGLALAAVGRLALTAPLFAAARVDWSRRGGETMDAVDVLGASAGMGVTVLARDSLALALIAQLRGDLRLASTRAAAPVSRGALSAAAELELALPATPITAGIRIEQGLTALVPGSRDRAVLVEVGVDWR